MANSHRIHGAPKTAVLYLYDPQHEPPLPVEPATGGIIVVAPTSAADLEQMKTFFTQAATELGLRVLITGD